ncbi:MAG: glycosyltransferase, partial [Opitutales bacterium]|nr:glycosyltransferase [Opitutales bacterium]
MLSLLDSKRSDLKRDRETILSLIDQCDRDGSSVDKLEQKLAIREEEIGFLWNEIEKLKHGYQTQEQLRESKEREIQHLREFIGKCKLNSELLHTSDPGHFDPPELKDFHSKYKANESLVRHFYAGLDTPDSHLNTDPAEMLHVGGWCFDERGRSAKRVWILVGDRKIPCTVGWKRSDVMEAFESQLKADLRCGFNVEVAIGAGLNALRVFAEFQNGGEVCMFRRTVVRLGDGSVQMGQLDQDYDTWVQWYDTFSEEELEGFRSESKQFSLKPKISVILPTYNTAERWLVEAIESVRKQVYENWELCISDDASPDFHVKSILEQYASIDERIKVVVREENGHISASSNSALELASGEFCALLDHDDLLPKHALFFVAKEINDHPEVNLIYSDEDKIDEQGKRFDPYFKSDWNRELFYSHNCVSHLGVYRTKYLREIGGFKEDLYGSQDWDLALRFIEVAGEKSIRHIPKVLYHWRYLDSSTSKSIETKPYAVEAGRRAIQRSLSSRGIRAEVLDGMWVGSFRVKYHLERAAKAAILIDADVPESALADCVTEILQKTKYPDFEICLLSSGGSGDLKFNDHRVRWIQTSRGSGTASSYNEVAKDLDAEVLVFLSGDTLIRNGDWLEELVGQLQQADVGVVGPWLQYADGVTYSAGMFLHPDKVAVDAHYSLPENDIGHMGRAHLIQRFSAVSTKCLLTSRQDFLKLGGFEDLTHFWNVDYCLRMRKELNKASLFTPYAKLVYREFGNPASVLEDPEESNQILEKWRDSLLKDDYFNP